MRRPGGDFTPGGADFFEKPAGLFQGRPVVVQVGAEQAPGDVVVQRCQPLRQLAAAFDVERRQKAIVDDVQRARDRFALGRHATGLHVHARGADRHTDTVEQHVDQLGGGGSKHVALHPHAGVGASPEPGTHQVISSPFFRRYFPLVVILLIASNCCVRELLVEFICAIMLSSWLNCCLYMAMVASICCWVRSYCSFSWLMLWLRLSVALPIKP